MFTIRARHAAALGVAVATLVTSGLVAPVAFAVAEEHVDDATTTAVDAPEAAEAAAGGPEASDGREAPEVPALPADEVVEPLGSDGGAPAEAQSVETTAEMTRADTTVAEEVAPAAVDSARSGASADLISTTELAAGASITAVFDVEEVSGYYVAVLGEDTRITMRTAGGTLYATNSLDGFSQLTVTAPARESGTVTIVVTNLADVARTLPYAFSARRAGVDLGTTASAGQPQLMVSTTPVVEGEQQRGYTARARVVSASGVIVELPMNAVTPTSPRSEAHFSGLADGRYLIEVSATIGGVVHEWVRTSTVAAPETNPPVVVFTSEPAASNANGWFRRTVAGTLAASDEGAGVWRVMYSRNGGTPAVVLYNRVSVPFSTEGVHTLSYWAEDYQGNVGNPIERLIRIDLTNPTAILGGLVENAIIEQGAEVVVDYSCSDALSQISTCTGTVPTGTAIDTSEIGVHTMQVIAVDRAGNDTRVTRAYTVVAPDITAPVVEATRPAEPATGWYTEPTTVSIVASDDESGVEIIRWEYPLEGGLAHGVGLDGHVDVEFEHTGEYELSFHAEDRAGNRSETQTITIRVDVDRPSVDIVTPADRAVSIHPNGDFEVGERIGVQYSCDDFGSGIESCEGPTIDGGLLDTSTAGIHEFRVVATDVAGNRTERSVSYVVAAPAGTARLVSTGSELLLPGVVLVAILLGSSALLLVLRNRDAR